MENVKKQHSHETHDHKSNNNQNHDHEHGKMPIVMYFIGLALALVALVLSEEYVVLQNILFLIATISAGYHVIILEGIGETVENTKVKKRVNSNSHMVMA